jgi:hypothetical protein
MQFDKHGRPFRRPNYLPGAVLIAAVAVVSLMRLAVSGPDARRRIVGKHLIPLRPRAA